MFQETLVESIPGLRRRKRWPMAVALSLQIIAACVLVVVPLLSTGVIPVATSVPLFAPLAPVRVEAATRPSSGGGGPGRSDTVYTPAAGHTIHIPIPGDDPRTDDVDPTKIGTGSGPVGPSLNIPNAVPIKPVPAEHKPKPVSVLSEAVLVKRVVPAYPPIAIRTAVQGDVKLVARIGRDGKLENLTLISGHPLLVEAALNAVKQWEYRPYVLNGETVEVETYITVSFRRNN